MYNSDNAITVTRGSFLLSVVGKIAKGHQQLYTHPPHAKPRSKRASKKLPFKSLSQHAPLAINLRG